MSAILEQLERIVADIIDIKTLKTKRGSQKGNLTRLATYRATTSDLPLLEHMKLNDVIRKSESVSENIAAHDIIQERIECIADESVLAADVSEVEELRIFNDFIDKYEELLEILRAWNVGVYLREEATELLEADAIMVGRNKKLYRQLVEDDKMLRETVMAHPSRMDLKEFRQELLPMMKELSERVNREIVASG